MNFRCCEAIGLDQSFEAQLWRSRRTERPLTGAMNQTPASKHRKWLPIFFSLNHVGLLEALIFDLGIYEGFRLKTLKTLYSYLLALSVKLRARQRPDTVSEARYYR